MVKILSIFRAQSLNAGRKNGAITEVNGTFFIVNHTLIDSDVFSHDQGVITGIYFHHGTRNMTMCHLVNRLAGGLVGSLHQAEQGACTLVYPELEILYSILFLNSFIFGMGF